MKYPDGLGPVARQKVVVGQLIEVRPLAPAGANRSDQVVPPSVVWMICEPTATQFDADAQDTERSTFTPAGTETCACHVRPPSEDVATTGAGEKVEAVD